MYQKSIHKSRISHIATSPNGDYCASADKEGYILLWDVKNFEPIALFENHQKITELFVTNQGQISATIPDNYNPNQINYIEFFKKQLDPEFLTHSEPIKSEKMHTM